MTEGDSYARPFKKGDWYEVTATGYDNKGKKIAETKIKLADYKTDTDTLRLQAPGSSLPALM